MSFGGKKLEKGKWRIKRKKRKDKVKIKVFGYIQRVQKIMATTVHEEYMSREKKVIFTWWGDMVFGMINWYLRCPQSEDDLLQKTTFGPAGYHEPDRGHELRPNERVPWGQEGETPENLHIRDELSSPIWSYTHLVASYSLPPVSHSLPPASLSHPPVSSHFHPSFHSCRSTSNSQHDAPYSYLLALILSGLTGSVSFKIFTVYDPDPSPFSAIIRDAPL